MLSTIPGYRAVSLAICKVQTHTERYTDVDYAFQALAIDEKRLTFPPTLWHEAECSPAIRLEQCWFPGIHGNVGGQADIPRSAGDREEIGYNTFAWMVRLLNAE
jgi:hypothetical protein